MNSSGKPPFHQRTRKNLKESKSITVFIPKEETLVKIAKRNKSRSRTIASMLTQGGVLFPTSKTPLKVMKDTSLALCLEPL